jgi:hypothetical protein
VENLETRSISNNYKRGAFETALSRMKEGSAIVVANAPPFVNHFPFEEAVQRYHDLKKRTIQPLLK